MYEVYLNAASFLHNVSQGRLLISPKLSLEINSAGSFEFTILPNHPLYDAIKKMKSEITVKQNGVEIFSGRPTKVTGDLYNRRKIYCEGELAYLNDSVQRPQKYQDMTVRGYLKALLDVHNAQVDSTKQFQIGVVTVTDSNDSLYRYTNWENTLSVIKKDLLESLGGYLFIRKENNVRYVDYLADFPNTSTQVIQFGKNLLDFTRNFDATDIATAIIPLGAKISKTDSDGETDTGILEERLTIKEINGGNDFVYSQTAVETYGWIFRKVIWDNVNTTSALKSKGERYLAEVQFENMSIEAKAIDLRFIDGSSDQLMLGDKIRVLSSPHGLDKYFPLTKMTVYLDKASKNTVTLGIAVRLSLTDSNVSTNSDIQNKIDSIPSKSDILQEAIDNATALINQKTTGYVTVTGDELLIMDTKDKETATKVWRWNLNGLGYSSTGYKGPFATAITMDGQIVGERLVGGSISAEKIDITYRTEVENKISSAESNANEHTDNALKNYYNKTEVESSIKNASDSIALSVTETTTKLINEKLENYATTEVVESQINVAINAIELEVERATKAEDALNTAINTANSNLSSFQEEVHGTFKDGLISETESMSIERYLNTIQTDYDMICGQYEAIYSSIQVTKSYNKNLLIKFNAESRSESNGTTVYDGVSLYYRLNGNIYAAFVKQSATNLAGMSYIVPSTEIYVYWQSDGSNTGYGFKLDQLDPTSSAATVSGNIATLPEVSFSDVKTADAIATTHPYGNSEKKMWHYKADTVTQADIRGLKTALDTAYTVLVQAVADAIQDGKTTSEEKQAVDTAFSEYNTAISELKEAIGAAQTEISAHAAETAYSSLKVTSDAITAEVARAKENEAALSSKITQTAEEIQTQVSTKVGNDEIISTINQSAETITIQASKINFNGLITANSRFRILSDGAFSALYGTIGGWTVRSNYIQSSNGNITLYSDGRIQIAQATMSALSQALTIRYGLHVYAGTDEFSDGSDAIKLFNLSHVTSGGHVVFANDGATVAYLSSSSKRYKDPLGEVTSEEAKSLLNLPVVWYKYKPGYLARTDVMVDAPLPGFYAEDVMDVFPEGVQYNTDGEPEDWNYRTIIPLMLKLIQGLYERDMEK